MCGVDDDPPVQACATLGAGRRGRPRGRQRGARHGWRASAWPLEPRTLGRTYAGCYRPSTFLTLTLDSYGRVDADGAAVDPDRYDYRRAARDAIHFAKLVDRFWQNTRRCLGWEVQYFGSVEPQRRGAPHFHAAVRGGRGPALVRGLAGDAESISDVDDKRGRVAYSYRDAGR